MSINALCCPTDLVGDNEHKHECDDCGTCWRHDDYSSHDDETFDEAHTCPKCGNEVTLKLMDEQQVAKRCRAIDRLSRLLKMPREFVKLMAGD